MGINHCVRKFLLALVLIGATSIHSEAFAQERWSYGGTPDLPKMGYGIPEQYYTWFTCDPQAMTVDVVASTRTSFGEQASMTLSSPTGSISLSSIVEPDIADYVTGQIPYREARAFLSADSGPIEVSDGGENSRIPGTNLAEAFGTFRDACGL